MGAIGMHTHLEAEKGLRRNAARKPVFDLVLDGGRSDVVRVAAGETLAAFALPLQGGGVGVLFLTVFAAYRLYALLPAVLRPLFN